MADFNIRLTSVALTDDELVLLDGHVGEKTQKVVDRAAARVLARTRFNDLSPILAGFVADVLTEARDNGELVWRHERLSYCALCGRQGGYATYKSGPRRGDKNFDRRLTFSGVELARRFVHIQHRVTLGGCDECVTITLPTIKSALAALPVQLPIELRTVGAPVWQKHDVVRCTKCGWTGHEGQMGRRRTILGEGTYPSTCPSCGAENGLGSRPVEHAEGFTLVALDG